MWLVAFKNIMITPNFLRLKSFHRPVFKDEINFQWYNIRVLCVKLFETFFFVNCHIVEIFYSVFLSPFYYFTLQIYLSIDTSKAKCCQS